MVMNQFKDCDADINHLWKETYGEVLKVLKAKMGDFGAGTTVTTAPQRSASGGNSAAPLLDGPDMSVEPALKDYNPDLDFVAEADFDHTKTLLAM